MKLLTLLVALACASELRTEEPITIAPGDARVDGSIIHPYRNRWKLVGTAPDGTVKEMGTWSDDVSIVSIDGKPVIRRWQVWNYGAGTESYFNLLDQRSLTPLVSHYTNTPGVFWRFEYHGTQVDFQRAPQTLAGSMSHGTVTAKMPVFDFNGGMFGLLIAGFPLQEGFSARIPVFRTFDPGAEPAWVDFHVEGKERVPAGPGKEVEAWRVIVNSPATEEVMRFALTKEPPYVIRLQQEWEGRDWTFEML